jgi:hypothetical protein
MRLALLSAAALFALAAPLGAQTPQAVEVTPDQLLSPYYEALKAKVAMPVAGPNPALSPATTLTRIAVGSCNHQSAAQHMWAQIASANPQLMILGYNHEIDQQGVSCGDFRAIRTHINVCSEGHSDAVLADVVDSNGGVTQHECGVFGNTLTHGRKVSVQSLRGHSLGNEKFQSDEAVPPRPKVQDGHV